MQRLHLIARRALPPTHRAILPTSQALPSRRWTSSVSPSSTNAPPIFQLTPPNTFPYDSSLSSTPSPSTLHNLSWTIADRDAWAILSPSSSSPSKAHLLSLLRSHIRVHPASAASHPILNSLPPIPRPAEEGGPRNPEVGDIIQFVSFKTRLSTTGEFEDFTARYFHIRDEDKLTVRQHLEQSLPVQVGVEAEGEAGDPILETAKLLKIDHLLELPLVTLSNGQTRRARIVRALLTKPELLILEEPFKILSSSSAREMLAAGQRERAELEERRRRKRERAEALKSEQKGEKLIELKGMNVVYGDEERPRVVLKGIDWTIREGERWVLAGHNGSGKSTLLSVILGDHPRSYTEDVTMFGKPRYKQATATIQANIGHVSPEINNAFPRKFGPGGLTAQEAILTGFDSIFCYRRPTPQQLTSLSTLLTSFSYPLLTPTFLSQPFAALTPGEQSLILLLRALVKRPPLLVLDECFSGMSKEMVDKVKRYLDEGLEESQSVVVISHFEEEVPESCVRLMRLEKGSVVEMV
ncbi:P-loop containing nucleoside triphosphate hydrolase protein [Leucosporidium creatinivorum]|uniref:p-loop containing nucleoside triphosphate hydrolase protein n=1 Tax=Leucosporidium creatinivorum TaxID=106004 RepID=A0A1Y2EVT6_9BASI|nr:P-loop containing nucleoside triphosphate hydrolase protein [Leucosporidium creatinivorum]